jgi:hypothetical protein
MDLSAQIASSASHAEDGATIVRIHSAPSQVTIWSFSARSSPRASKKAETVSLVRPLAAQITLPVRWSQTTVR